MTEESIQREAARWFTRLQAVGLPLEETVAWQRWMVVDPRHAEAFQRMEEVWQRFGSLPRPALLPREVLARDDYDGTVPVSQWSARRKTWSHGAGRSLWRLAACVAAVALGATLMLTLRGPGQERFETSVGENRTVTLADGSRVSLGGSSRVEIRFRKDRRLLTLLQGEALFAVAADPGRPFTVRAGSAVVTALGTQFDVQRSVDRVMVAVLEGRVRVQPTLALLPTSWLEDMTPIVTRGEGTAVDAGSRTVVNRAGVGRTDKLADAAVVTGWQQGRLAFEDEPLRDVVDVVNRYSFRRIVIDDPAIAELRVSGTVVQDHIDGWIASLNTAFGVRAVEDEAATRLRR